MEKGGEETVVERELMEGNGGESGIVWVLGSREKQE